MMKNYNPFSKTLAIGDGGNDVSMIMEAHIGVGIYGEEGLRAVQNSDYAIGEFRFLHELLFYHGRTNYIRNAQCILYFFYKNFVFTFLQFVFGFYCNFTGQTIIDDWFITLFNLLFTSLPLGARALLDHDVKPNGGEIVYLMLPFLYLENRENPDFTVRKFFLTLLKGIIHSLINFFCVVYMLDDSVNSDGDMGGLWFISVNLFSNILIIVSIELLILTKYHTWVNFVIMFVITFIAYIIFIIIVHNLSLFNSYGTMNVAFSSGKTWLNMLLVGGTCGLIDYFLLGVEFIFFPSLASKIRVLINKKINMNLDNFQGMPELIKDILGNYTGFTSEPESEKSESNKSKVDIINVESVNEGGESNKNEQEVMKMKNNRTTKELNVRKEGEDSQNTKEENQNNNNRTKSTTKPDVVLNQSNKKNKEIIIEGDTNSKEAFIK